MCTEEIKQRIESTSGRARKMITPTELHAVLDQPVIFQCNIDKLKEETPLHHIRMDTPPIVRTFYYQHGKELLNIVKYVQTLSLGNADHPLDIDSLAEAAVQH